MQFTIVPYKSKFDDKPSNQAYLISDGWNDFSYRTLFILYYKDKSGNIHNIGNVKIGQFGKKEDSFSTDIPVIFEQLDKDFFSLGQDSSYYESLNKFGEQFREDILSRLNDIAKNEELFSKAINERVTQVSLLRDVSPASVKGQFRRLAHGGARLTAYEFRFTLPSNRKNHKSVLNLSFQVKPESNPPTNIHVLIGRNGVGKTYLINNMIKRLTDTKTSSKGLGVFESNLTDTSQEIFANLVFVSFSAFDESEHLPEVRDKTAGIKYSYIGLKRLKNESNNLGSKTPLMLKNEFIQSVEVCRRNFNKGRQWKRAMEMLETDANFKEIDISSIIDLETDEQFKKNASDDFSNLSSGHKIVLLSITRLIETVEERTLILIDEPEAHLHPPLLSALIRVLSDLLIQKNGVAIIATHSPVVLQEVPRSCVWKLRRNGAEAIAERPEIECFGENVGVLTREIFGLEVTYSVLFP